MTRKEGSDDKDQEYLDSVISLCDDIKELVEKIKEISDDPEVLRQALYIESNALIIQKRTRDYRPRLIELKREIGKQKNRLAAANTSLSGEIGITD